MKIKRLLMMLLLLAFSFGAGGGCDNDDGGGADVTVECEDFIDSLCARFVTCETFTTEECDQVFDILFSEEEFDCKDLVAGEIQSECSNDLEDFDCNELASDNLPESCGGQLSIPETT